MYVCMYVCMSVRLFRFHARTGGGSNLKISVNAPWGCAGDMGGEFVVGPTGYLKGPEMSVFGTFCLFLTASSGGGYM